MYGFGFLNNFSLSGGTPLTIPRLVSCPLCMVNSFVYGQITTGCSFPLCPVLWGLSLESFIILLSSIAVPCTDVVDPGIICFLFSRIISDPFPFVSADNSKCSSSLHFFEPRKHVLCYLCLSPCYILKSIAFLVIAVFGAKFFLSPPYKFLCWSPNTQYFSNNYICK